jgi:hypothetical protein
LAREAATIPGEGDDIELVCNPERRTDRGVIGELLYLGGPTLEARLARMDEALSDGRTRSASKTARLVSRWHVVVGRPTVAAD